MDAFQIKQHDTQPSLAATLSDDNGPIVIPGGAVVTFVMRKVADCGCGTSANNNGLSPGQYGYCNPPASQVTSAPAVNRAAVVVNAATGQVRYDWAAGDTSAPGEYSGEFKVSVSSLVTTYPSEGYIPIIINPDLL